MTKDKNGVEIKVGDHVTLRGTVYSLRAENDAANLTVELADPAPNSDKPTRITLSALQAERAAPPARPARHKDE